MNRSTALLARPHPVIVDAMRDVLIASGLEPRALSSREELLRWPAEDVALVVVSTSVHSTVQASFEDIIRQVSNVFPSAALVIGTAVDPEHARGLLADMLALYRIEGRLRTARELAERRIDPADGRDILLVSRQELAQADGRATVVGAVSRLLAAPEAGVFAQAVLPWASAPGRPAPEPRWRATP